MRINNKGDIVPNKISSNTNYKNSYYWDDGSSDINTIFAGGGSVFGYRCGLLCIFAHFNIGHVWLDFGFAKVTILDN